MKIKKNKVKAIIAGISIAAVVGVAGIVAYFTDTATVTNHAKMGIVDIDLKEYTLDSTGAKVNWTDKTNVLPGETIDKIAEIEVVDGAADCYVRAKVEITAKDATLQRDSKMLTLDNLNVNTSNWYYCEADGYYYYKNILKDSDNPITLFSTVTIPNNWNNDWSLEDLSIDVTAEAIQSKNFTPNFTAGSTNPWPGITAADIEVCRYPTHVKQ